MLLAKKGFVACIYTKMGSQLYVQVSLNWMAGPQVKSRLISLSAMPPFLFSASFHLNLNYPQQLQIQRYVKKLRASLNRFQSSRTHTCNRIVAYLVERKTQSNDYEQHSHSGHSS